jgi:hypothetical protein
MDSLVLCLQESPARRSFKKIAGQNNHFLITIHVGLAAVEGGTITIPPDMRVAWDPRDHVSSAARSRGFANKAALAWLVDALDTYIRILRDGSFIASQQLRNELAEADSRDKGLAGRVGAVAQATRQSDTAEAKLVEIAIAWRNRLVHQRASGNLSRAIIAAARSYADHFAENYQGMLIDELIKRAGLRPAAPPTLKEVTAIIRAAHKLTERIDMELLSELNASEYLVEVLSRHLTEGTSDDAKTVMARAGKIWGKSESRRRSAIMQIAFNNGFSEYLPGALNQVDKTVIDELVNLTPSEAVEKLTV